MNTQLSFVSALSGNCAVFTCIFVLTVKPSLIDEDKLPIVTSYWEGLLVLLIGVDLSLLA